MFFACICSYLLALYFFIIFLVDYTIWMSLQVSFYTMPLSIQTVDIHCSPPFKMLFDLCRGAKLLENRGMGHIKALGIDPTRRGVGA